MSQSVDMKQIIAPIIGSDCESCGSTAKTDETKIRRPPNAFMIFGKEYRKILSLKFPEFSNKQISKILGKEWKDMNEELKNYYHKLADQIHKQHLIKYPGYYYSPLEARQRKAEKKRKSKMSKNVCEPKGSEQISCLSFGQSHPNRPFLMRGSYPMVRPMFGTRMPARHPIRVTQPAIDYGPHNPFGGFALFGGFRQPMRPMFVVPLQEEHNYSFNIEQQPQQQSIEQMGLNFETNSSSHQNLFEQQKNAKLVNEMCVTDLSSLMSNFLPAMHNPLTEVTEVIDNQSNDKQMKDETEVTKMESVCTNILEDDLLVKISEDSIVDKNAKVIVKRMNEFFDQFVESIVSNEGSDCSH